MNWRAIGQSHRVIRRRLRLRQIDVATRSGVGRNKVSAIERGDLGGVSLAELGRCFDALEARLDVVVRWRGAGLDRLFDEAHALVSGRVAGILKALGWQVEMEVTFSSYGERGSIDLLAWHPGQRVLLVIEVKTEIGSIDGLLRPLDVKVRLGAAIASERFGWQPLSVGRLVVMPDDRTARRMVARHGDVLGLALPVRAVAVRRWLRNPVGPLAGLWFLSSARRRGVTRNPSSIRRVRVAGSSVARA